METERTAAEPWRLCRACGAERRHMSPLSARHPDVGLRLDDILMACTDLKIRVGDSLPSSICYSCADELKTSYRFKQRCETTDRYFNQLGLKANEIKQEQETVVFKEGENENLSELKDEKDTNDNSSSLSFKEVIEGISEAVVISRETKQEQGDLLTITETMVYKQEEIFSEVTEDETIRVGNLENSPPNEDLRFEDFPNKKENRNIISKEAENEFSSGSKEQKEEEMIHDGGSKGSSSSEVDDFDSFPREQFRKTDQLGIRGKYSLSSNLRTHESLEQKRFECEVCGKSYSRSWYLRQHKKTHESNGERKYYKCDVCEKSYSWNCNLRKHMETHENGGAKRFECDVCGKSYAANWNLQEHKWKHAVGGRKRSECDVCERSFATSRYLRQHKKTHENGGEKRFECDICEKSFSTSRYLREHRNTHEDGAAQKRFECGVCGKSYSWGRGLQEHEKTHADGGRKRYECDVCGKSYSESSYLRYHRRRHADEKVSSAMSAGNRTPR